MSFGQMVKWSSVVYFLASKNGLSYVTDAVTLKDIEFGGESHCPYHETGKYLAVFSQNDKSQNYLGSDIGICGSFVYILSPEHISKEDSVKFGLL